MRGGWHGAMGTVGGLTRTYGLQDHFTKPELDGRPPAITRAGIKRVGGYFRPYLATWVSILACIGVTAGLNVLPPSAWRGSWIGRSSGGPAAAAMLAAAMVGLGGRLGVRRDFQQTLTAKVGQNIMFDLRNQLYGTSSDCRCDSTPRRARARSCRGQQRCECRAGRGDGDDRDDRQQYRDAGRDIGLRCSR